MQTEIELPKILTENTFFWNPGKNASTRRNNESKNINTIKQFFIKNQYSNIVEDDNTISAELITDSGLLTVEFYYRESCNKVYKKQKISLDNKKKDIRILRKVKSLQEIRNNKINELLSN